MGNASILFIKYLFYTIKLLEVVIIIELNIIELLKKNNHTKYWLCQKMNITSRNLNRIIRGETNSISFKYLYEFCKYLNCTPSELITIVDIKNKDTYEN